MWKLPETVLSSSSSDRGVRFLGEDTGLLTRWALVATVACARRTRAPTLPAPPTREWSECAKSPKLGIDSLALLVRQVLLESTAADGRRFWNILRPHQGEFAGQQEDQPSLHDRHRPWFDGPVGRWMRPGHYKLIQKLGYPLRNELRRGSGTTMLLLSSWRR